jgi:hypothetical protein
MSESDIRAFGDHLRELLSTDAAYDALGTEVDGDWTEGGCWILAEALKDLIGRGAKLVAVLGQIEEFEYGYDTPKLKWDVAHVAVQVGGFFLDGHGASSRGQFERMMSEEYGRIKVVPFSDAVQRTAKRNIVCPVRAVRRVEKFLQESLPR